MDDDVTDTLAPKSDQLDAIDLLNSPPRIFTITKVDVRKGAEQPVSVHLAEFPRVWRPGKNMRRVLAYCWGNKSSAWVGRRVELFCDESVTFGGNAVSGTRISRLSHIDGSKSAPVINGKKPGTYRVDPLPDDAVAPAAKSPSLKDRLTAGMKARGITEREDALAYVESIIGRAAPSSELSDDELARVVEALEQPMGAES